VSITTRARADFFLPEVDPAAVAALPPLSTWPAITREGPRLGTTLCDAAVTTGPFAAPVERAVSAPLLFACRLALRVLIITEVSGPDNKGGRASWLVLLAGRKRPPSPLEGNPVALRWC